tara:strand:- start:131 stop:763 length:633 start_codon:yes stop_codon:yes gene_type:complete
VKIIAIEANIAAGKSTLLSPLREQLERLTGDEWQILIEPVDEDPEFHRLLKVYIENPHVPDRRIEFQKYLTHSRQEMLRDLPDGNYITERSLFSDIVFCQLNFLTMEMPSAHYMDYFYDIKRRLTDYPQIDAVVYIDRDPSECLRSIAKRGRDGEDGYSLEYIQDVKRFHDSCLPQICREYNTKLITNFCGIQYPNASMIGMLLKRNGVI